MSVDKISKDIKTLATENGMDLQKCCVMTNSKGALHIVQKNTKPREVITVIASEEESKLIMSELSLVAC